MITIKKLGKVYGKKSGSFRALDNIDLEIKSGSSVAIVGKSGSGKSTLMHIISGLDHPTEGNVVIDGINIHKLKGKELDKFRAEKIGFIFQAFFVQPKESAFSNVSLPLEIARVPYSSRKQKVTDALKVVELEDKIKQKAGTLSGGQKQRLAIARAIVNRPKIIFADEPTGNLDSTTGQAIETLLFDLNKKEKSTLIIVTHDEDLANKCDIKIYLKDGKIETIKGVKK
jgi:putative ABC transport system ATP-binding protein